MKMKRRIVSIDTEKCNGCGQCVKACAEGAIELFAGKARLVAERYCDGLAACLGECPQGAISMIEREADDFDPQAVERYLSHTTNHKFQLTNSKSGKNAKKLKSHQDSGNPQPPTFNLQSGDRDTLPSGCPSTQLQMFQAPSGCAEEQRTGSRQQSALTHWPVQIKLVPPTAAFLKNADLLVVSDCVPVAYPNFHRDFVKGRVVMMGCPKFDDIDEYINKFSQVFKTAGLNSITIAIMEVPCCSKMPLIIKKAMELAGKSIPTESVVINARGNIMK